MKLISYDLDEYSLDTVKMFYDDAVIQDIKNLKKIALITDHWIRMDLT